MGQAWRQLLREFRSGELRLLALALVVAVAAVTAVGFFADRVHRALEREAHQLLGGDLLLVADHPAGGRSAEAARRGLQSAETWVFPSMVMADGKAQLADVKAASPGYPLRGKLRIRALDAAAGADQAAPGGPARGTVWLEERLANSLGLLAGGQLSVGQAQFSVAAILTQEPDRGVNFFSLAPRLLLNLDDLAATGLVQVNSRVTYRFLVAGEADRVEAFRRWLAPRLARGERVEDAANARPEIRTALDRPSASSVWPPVTRCSPPWRWDWPPVVTCKGISMPAPSCVA